MKTLSAKKLAETVKRLREEKGLTKIELGNLTGINRILVGRIENEDFIPSISQFEELAKVLGFDVSNMFVEKESSNSYTALRSETINDAEKEGVDILFKMMIALRQQVILRRKYLNESGYNAL
jgi:transcriptional regulator with XRE-family HTH domain